MVAMGEAAGQLKRGYGGLSDHVIMENPASRAPKHWQRFLSVGTGGWCRTPVNSSGTRAVITARGVANQELRSLRELLEKQQAKIEEHGRQILAQTHTSRKTKGKKEVPEEKSF